jgi:multicomponent Na+:H+ antiporter subunit D
LIFLAFGIKIPFFAFLAHDSRYLAEAHEPPRNMLLAMAIAAALCVGIGSLPAFFYGFLPFETGYMPYEAGHVLAQLQLLAFSALAFTWLRLSGLYPPELRPVNLDAEWLYRRLMPELAHRIMRLVAPINRKARLRARVLAKCSLKALAWHHGSRGELARSASIGNMVLWVVALLGLSLLLHYL